eukprot:11159107-Lingulodinium_polyedra.AAC.1
MGACCHALIASGFSIEHLDKPREVDDQCQCQGVGLWFCLFVVFAEASAFCSVDVLGCGEP